MRSSLVHLRGAALLICALVAIGCKDRPTTGALVLTVSGLPAGARAGISVIGPNQFFQSVDATSTLESLAPGLYTLVVRNVRFGVALYNSPVTQQSVTVTAGHTEAASVAFALGTGSVNISVSGLPPALPPSMLLTCTTCGAYTRPVSSEGVVTELPPGTYVLRADTLITIDGDRFGPASYQQTIVVTASLIPVDASVSYALSSGTLAITVNGLGAESQVPNPITVTGPGNFRRTLAASASYRGLLPGAYTITALTAQGACPNVYAPAVPLQSATITAASTTQAEVSFSPTQVVPANLNLGIDAVHLVQVVQDYPGATPLVAGKRALLRVFALANQCNTGRPKVRVTLSGIPNARTIDLETPESSVRTSADPGVLLSSYNVMLPAADVQPGLGVVAEVDPTGVVAEANETDNRYPASGAKAVDVRVVPSVGVRFIPVTIGATTGVVSAARVDSLLEFSRTIHPTFSYAADVGGVFTSSGQALQTGGGGWNALLSELEAKRAAEQQKSGDMRYYHGIVPVTYQSGIAGIGYIGGKTALTWDRLPSASEIMAHELGHNFGRFHAPCGSPTGPDENYPSTGNYVQGHIGQYGIDLRTMELKQPQFYTDIMGYCSRKWISDYTYSNVMQWLIDHPVSFASTRSGAVEPSLLLWGRITDGQPVLEPAFELQGRAQLPVVAGPHRITAVDAAGAEILSFAFGTPRIADLPGDNGTFAFVLPVSMLRGRAVAALRFTANGRTVTSAASGAVTEDAQTVVTRPDGRTMRLRWNAARFPAVMVRDAATGEVLAFARGGDATIVTNAAPVELTYSNRVGSVRERRLR